MEDSFDLISIGDSTIDVFLQIDKYNTQCKLDTKDCYLALEYGSKIGVEKLTRIAAVGNSANNAIGSARLGLRAAIYTHVGDDADGKEVLEVFQKEKVDTSYVNVDSGKKTNFSTVINFSEERVILVYHEHRNYNLPDLAPAKWVYYSSAAAGHEILNTQIPQYLGRTDARLGFNPGTYQLKLGIEGLKPILAVCEVLLLNREEAHHLVDGDINDTKNLINNLRGNGPKIVIITDARNGAYASDGRVYLHSGIPEESPVVERTGAGDAFSTGSLAALANGKDLSEALIWGTLNSTSVVQFIGAREGLLTKEGIEKMRQMWGNSFKVEEF